MMKKKIKAFLIPQVIMFLIALSVFSFSAMATIPTVFGSLAAEGEAVQAMQYAEIEANIIKLLNYDDVDDDDVLLASNLHTTRADLTAINVPGWEDEVIIGDEELMGDGENKYKIATINIYKKDDTIPRATLEVPLSSQASAGDNLPIGTILAYNGSLDKIPKGWHLCDGTEGTPDLTDRFLEGSNSPGNFIEAGIPNITGRILAFYDWDGAFKFEKDFGYTHSGGLYRISHIRFDASRCSSVYRNDITTVQPASYTVYYIIKIK